MQNWKYLKRWLHSQNNISHDKLVKIRSFWIIQFSFKPANLYHVFSVAHLKISKFPNWMNTKNGFPIESCRSLFDFAKLRRELESCNNLRKNFLLFATSSTCFLWRRKSSDIWLFEEKNFNPTHMHSNRMLRMGGRLNPESSVDFFSNSGPGPGPSNRIPNPGIELDFHLHIVQTCCQAIIRGFLGHSSSSSSTTSQIVPSQFSGQLMIFLGWNFCHSTPMS